MRPSAVQAYSVLGAIPMNAAAWRVLSASDMPLSRASKIGSHTCEKYLSGPSAIGPRPSNASPMHRLAILPRFLQPSNRLA